MIANPYDSGQPVPRAHFAGRQKEARDIREYVVQSRENPPQHLAILGPWGVGKTSLLDFLEPDLRKDAVFIRLSAGEWEAEAPPALFSEIVTAICDELPKRAMVGMRPAAPADARAARKVLKDLWPTISEKGRLSVIVLDDAELLRAQASALMQLRTVFQNLTRDRCRYMLILSGRENLFEGLGVDSPARRFFRPIKLSNFNEGETREPITKPLSSASRLHFHKDAIAFIHGRTEGHPFFVKLLSHHIFALRGGKGVVRRDWIETNWNQICERLEREKFGDEFTELAPKEQEVLLLASQLSDPFEPREVGGQYGTELYRLSSGKSPLLLKNKRGQYSFYHPLFREYVRGIAQERGIRLKRERYIPQGRPLLGKEELEEVLRLSVRKKLDILDQHYREGGIPRLEVLPKGIRIRILAGSKEPRLHRVLEGLKEFAGEKGRVVELRVWPERDDNPFPAHVRALLGDLKAWEISHSLDQVGKEATRITEILEDRDKMEKDFEEVVGAERNPIPCRQAGWRLIGVDREGRIRLRIATSPGSRWRLSL